MIKKNEVCRYCTERKVGCHAVCEKYIKEKQEIREQNEKIWKEKDVERAATGIDIKRIRRAKGVK